MITAIGAVCLLVAAGQGGNLLLNPSFEDLTPDGRPAHWSAFVMPQSGAFADADPLALDGSQAAMLHVPNLYDREPANNWSQVVLADVGGKDLILSGEIRTEAAGGAALWLQCFTRNPARVAAAATSAIDRPISGTSEWTTATVRVAAPKDTDFVVVRCVLKGQGSAWFDNLRLEVAQPNLPELPAFEPAEDSLAASASDTPLREPDLLQLSKMLSQTIAELETSNSRILERVQRIQAELDRTRASSIEAPAPLEPAVIRHPLVPHGSRPQGDHP
jgi:hypothetical protein